MTADGHMLAGARDIRHADWRPDDVFGQYSDGNGHADLYRFLAPWIETDAFLNVGYSRLHQIHLSPKATRRLIERMGDGLMALRDAGPYPEARRMVDIASGRGGAAIHAYQHYGLEVIGVDFTPHNVRRARANAAAAGALGPVQFSLGNAKQLPLSTDSLGLAWSIESPAHFDDKPAFLSEVARILKPGGAFVMSDLLVVEDIAMASAANRAIYDGFLRTWDVPYLETRESYLREMNRVGLRPERVEIVTEYNLERFKFHGDVFLWLCGFERLYGRYARRLAATRGAKLDHVRDHVRGSWEALRLGMIDYGIFWAVRD